MFNEIMCIFLLWECVYVSGTDEDRHKHPTLCLYFEDMQETERYCVNVKYERKQDVVIYTVAMKTQRSDN